MPTKRRPKKRGRTYDGKHYWELLWGPSPWKPNALTEEQLIELWNGGGREDVIGSYHDQTPGFRPWAAWVCDIWPEIAEKATKAGMGPSRVTEAEIILWAGIDRPGEREAIEAEGIIERQREDMLEALEEESA